MVNAHVTEWLKPTALKPIFVDVCKKKPTKQNATKHFLYWRHQISVVRKQHFAFSCRPLEHSFTYEFLVVQCLTHVLMTKSPEQPRQRNWQKVDGRFCSHDCTDPPKFTGTINHVDNQT
mmetsp:Transcript_30060/g.64418  ORF Transcript_30060/g.64418 Transcript_30060/m.64418 type:complete len:119 (-) Transcript_30060:178-534(-)